METTDKAGLKPNARSWDLEPFFELSPDLLCIAGYDGYFKRINPAVSKVLGYTHDELFSRPINDFVYSEDQAGTEEVRNELRKNKPLYNFENRYLTKSGEIVWLSWTSLPVEEEQVIFAIAKNVTHKKLLEEERNALLEKLSQNNQELLQLTYTTSHDLRAPVNNLLSVFNFLDVSRISDPEILEFINILKLAGDNLQKTLDSYVDVLSQGNTVKDLEEIRFADVLKTVLNMVSTLLDTSGASVDADFSSVSSVRFNRAYLESIFLNLITNAIKYARPGVTPEISISSCAEDGMTRLVFSDNGLGFDMAKVKDRIFGLNQKFHDHKDSKGIGLYLVYCHVTSLGGQISVESEVNKGTTFTIGFV